jgi:hypothetical protein
MISVLCLIVSCDSFAIVFINIFPTFNEGMIYSYMFDIIQNEKLDIDRVLRVGYYIFDCVFVFL